MFMTLIRRIFILLIIIFILVDIVESDSTSSESEGQKKDDENKEEGWQKIKPKKKNRKYVFNCDEENENIEEGEQFKKIDSKKSIRNYVFKCDEFTIDENTLITEAMDYYKYPPLAVRKKKSKWEANHLLKGIIFLKLIHLHAPSEKFRLPGTKRDELFDLIEGILIEIENGEYKDYEKKSLEFKVNGLKIDENELIIVIMDFYKNMSKFVQQKTNKKEALYSFRAIKGSIFKKLMRLHAPSEKFRLEGMKKNDLYRRIDCIWDKIEKGEYNDYKKKSLSTKPQQNNIPSKTFNNKSYSSPILPHPRYAPSSSAILVENAFANKEDQQDSKATGILIERDKMDEKESEKKPKEGGKSYMEILLEGMKKKSAEDEKKKERDGEKSKIAEDTSPIATSERATGIWKNRPSFASVVKQPAQSQSTKNVLAAIIGKPKFPPLSVEKIPQQKFVKNEEKSTSTGKSPLFDSPSRFQQGQQKEAKKEKSSWDEKLTGRSVVQKW